MKINVNDSKEKVGSAVKKEPAAKTETVEKTKDVQVPDNNVKRKKSSLKNKLPKLKKKSSKNPDNSSKTRAKIKVNKKVLVSIACVAAICVAVALIIVTIVNQPKLDDSYFVSDETKDVITLEVDESTTNTNLVQTHIVYTYADDKITSLKTYFEYPDNETAAQALENTKNQNPNAKDVYVDQKYVIVVAQEDQYEKLTPNDIKQQAEAIKQYQASKKQDANKQESDNKEE